jgi:serine/threonine protein kinase
MLNNRYMIRSTLGRGGFGQTYLVEDTHSPSRRLRVVKQLKPQAGEADLFPLIRDRFEREAAILERLGDANDQIPTLHAYFSEAGEFYLVQDWIEGESLGRKVREEGAFGEPEAREFLLGILPVLDFVHSQNVIHRDINPNNVMIRARDGRPVLIDFGAVKEVVTTVIDSHGHPSSTIAIGSPGYMPLEQYAGRPVFASDIFSLGLTVIFSLTGKHPKEIHDLRTGEVSWREHAPKVSEHLAGVLTKAVEYHAHDRFPSAQEMLAALHVNAGPLVANERSPKVFRLGGKSGGALPAEATTRLSEETVLRRGGESEEQTLVSGDRSKAIEFIGNDKAYLRWLDENQGGYVVNTSRSISPKYMVLHKATCGMIKSTNGIPPGGFTERNYIKICSKTVEGLQSWVKQHGRPDGSFSSSCGACRPMGEYSLPVEQSRRITPGEEVVSVDEPVVAININQQYPQSKSDVELYHATRGIWRLNRQRAQKAQYAFAVFQGEVKEVYKIDRWMPATKETTEYWDKRSASQGKYFPSEVNEGRSEFIGEVAPEAIRKKYVGKQLPVRHSQNPIRYFNC